MGKQVRKRVIAVLFGAMSIAGISSAEGARNDYVREMLAQDSIGDPLDSITTLINNEDLVAPPVDRASLLILKEDWTAVSDFLNAYGDNGLKEDEAFVLQTVSDMRQHPTHVPTIYASAEQDLLAIAAQPNGAGYAMARSLIEQYGTQTFVDPIVFPSQGHSMMLHRPVVNTGAALLEAHPNPASDRLEVVTRLPKEENDASLMFIDSQGQELKRTPVPPGVQIQEWNTEGYAPGVYRLTLYGRRGVLDGRTIEIVR